MRCEYCGTNFSQKTNLLRHQKSLHFSIKYNCNQCQFTTTRKERLREHQFSKHQGNKFKCHQCSAEFSRKDSLQRHMKAFHPLDASLYRVYVRVHNRRARAHRAPVSMTICTYYLNVCSNIVCEHARRRSARKRNL